MTRRFMMAAMLAAVAVSGRTMFAHDDYRIIGTVSKVTADTIDVKQAKDGKIISMDMDADTIVTRDKKKVARAQVRPGAHVVVDARGDSIDELLVVEIRLVPAPTAK